MPCRAPRCLVARLARRIDAGEQALRRRFLVTGRAIDLPGEEQAVDDLGFKARLQIARIEVVVLDGIARPRDVRALEALDRMHQRFLDVVRQRGRNAVRVDLVRVQTFRLDEHLMRGLLGEAVDLVLDARAIARPGAFDHAREHRAAIESAADNLVRALVGVRDPARDLARVIGHGAEKREDRRRCIARLLDQPVVVDRAAIDARWRAGLEPSHP